MKIIISAIIIITSLLTIACSMLPQGADPVKYRIREAQLNLETIDKALPAAGFSVDDETRLHKLIAKLDAVLNSARDLSSSSALDQLQASLPVLQAIADQISDPNAKKQAARVIAVANVTISVLQNQAELQKEFPGDTVPVPAK